MRSVVVYGFQSWVAGWIVVWRGSYLVKSNRKHLREGIAETPAKSSRHLLLKVGSSHLVTVEPSYGRFACAQGP